MESPGIFESADGSVWDPVLYSNLCSFVPENGRELISMLNPREGERILDLGCGTGELSSKVAQAGADVTGLDASGAMIEAARRNYPDLTFIEDDAISHDPDESYDAIFSNAVLHWITRQDSLLSSVRSMLRPGGRFVVEMAREGNINRIRNELFRALNEAGYPPETLDPWFFPSAESYGKRLTERGFSLRTMDRFEHSAVLDGDEGFHLWLTVFCQRILMVLDQAERKDLAETVKERLRDDRFDGKSWRLNYRRLRFVAVRE